MVDYLGHFVKIAPLRPLAFPGFFVLKFLNVVLLHETSACLHFLIFSNRQYIGLPPPISNSYDARITSS